MKLLISLSAKKVKSVEGYTKHLAQTNIHVSDGVHDTDIDKGETFYLKKLKRTHYLIDADIQSKELYEFKITAKDYAGILKKHPEISKSKGIADIANALENWHTADIGSDTDFIPLGKAIEESLKGNSSKIPDFDGLRSNVYRSFNLSSKDLVKSINAGNIKIDATPYSSWTTDRDNIAKFLTGDYAIVVSTLGKNIDSLISFESFIHAIQSSSSYQKDLKDAKLNWHLMRDQLDSEAEVIAKGKPKGNPALYAIAFDNVNLEEYLEDNDIEFGEDYTSGGYYVTLEDIGGHLKEVLDIIDR